MSKICCEQVERRLGSYVDNELSAVERGEVEAHLARCSICQAELEELRELVGGIASKDPVMVSGSLWGRIEQRLDQSTSIATPARSPRRFPQWSAPWAIAAGLFLAVGLGIFGVASLETSAHASTIDFGVLLDALPLDAQKAFRKFLVLYDATPTTPVAAKRIAHDLNFDTPLVLPGGFRLQSVYELTIAGTKGIAASYDRDGELLAVVFHPPMKHEKFGSHNNYPCVIGEHCGHKVQVGEWKLVHLTDATTCHCLLSRLDEQNEMPAVMAAIAPRLSETGVADRHQHPDN